MPNNAENRGWEWRKSRKMKSSRKLKLKRRNESNQRGHMTVKRSALEIWRRMTSFPGINALFPFQKHSVVVFAHELAKPYREN